MPREGKQDMWWARRDSNSQPSGYEPPALTIELQALPVALAGSEYVVAMVQQHAGHALA